MSLVSAFDDIKPDMVTCKSDPRGRIITTSAFFKATPDTPVAPTAYVARFDPGRSATAHYHIADEFQVIFDGKGKFGRHEVSPRCVHFARAYTCYGPLLADAETGWAFMTLRTRYDPGSLRRFDEMKRIPGRRPWQITKKIAMPAPAAGVRMEYDPDIKDDQGLFTCSLSMAPNTTAQAPSPFGGDGQFMMVIEGSLLHGSKEHRALTVVFVKPTEGAFQVRAGAQGLQALILNLPQVRARAAERSSGSAVAGLSKWQCVLCAFEYDEAQGIPEEGIAAGTRWADVPDSWSCPSCSATKRDFQMIEV